MKGGQGYCGMKKKKKGKKKVFITFPFQYIHH